MTAKWGALALALTLAVTGPAWAQEDPVAEAIQDYLDFATYEAGIILPDQITEEMLPSVTFIDTRDAAQFEAGTIEGAANIEWREIPARLDELPEDGLVVLFCNTGSLSAQATFAARLLGRENVVVLQDGIQGWLAR
ncbi:rhodanese-like domain-containing protein [Actibacterium sp. MT2.3-13A]|uniref:rhodanese-like domain-containing protein n=1 Tax=Actibacterium sp. MT2.3-13A TaxID=2828332 RepID=UPI001BAA145F|nr:rhodanese-like domain-containing protein [Actibacterium sp. MT2.3-13A]